MIYQEVNYASLWEAQNSLFKNKKHEDGETRADRAENRERNSDIILNALNEPLEQFHHCNQNREHIFRMRRTVQYLGSLRHSPSERGSY